MKCDIYYFIYSSKYCMRDVFMPTPFTDGETEGQRD